MQLTDSVRKHTARRSRSFNNMNMADGSAPTVVEELAGILKFHSDGSITRTELPTLMVPPNSEFALDEDWGVITKDVVLEGIKPGLWVRLYLPPRRTTHMPLLIYFHGGGFCVGSPAFTSLHRLCLNCAATAGAIIVSVNYRLAPEHRLPAAYEDSMAAVEWVRSQSVRKRTGEADPWFDSHADFSNVYLMGDSAGGNIAHHVAVWTGGMQWEVLRIRGMILLQPFFGGQDRTTSEIGCHEGAVLSLEGTDKIWRLALPIGSDRDHHFCNPFGRESPSLADAALPPVLVFIGDRDLLSDRQLRYCEALKKSGKKIQHYVFEGEEHGFYCLKPDSGNLQKLLQHVSDFILSNS